MSLGAYGALGDPSGALATVESIADTLAASKLFSSTSVFVYAIDESCGSSLGADWKSALSGSSDANTKNVLVGWTCSQDPTKQPVDVPIVMADSYDPQQAATARGGKAAVDLQRRAPPDGRFLHRHIGGRAAGERMDRCYGKHRTMVLLGDHLLVRQ